jgi:nucleotide-binding universal stress UspA family protein
MQILVLTPHEDRAGRAVNLALELAQRTGARVKLLRVLQENLGVEGSSQREGRTVPLREVLLEAETRRLEELGERLRSSAIDVSVEVCWGVPWEIVLRLVEREAYDLVVKPASGLDRQGRVFFGSTALHLFRRCPCPVWVVVDEGRLPSRVLAAIDPSGAPQRKRVANRIVDWAERVGEWAEASVDVATAWSAPAADLLSENLPEDELKAYVQDAQERVVTNLNELLAARPAPPDSDRIHVVEGAAQDAIARFSEEHDIDLIVMGTLCRDDAVGDLLGETAETIIRQVRSSVLTIPPAAARESS